MTDERQAKRYTIHGRVQGVGFRWFTRQSAEEIGVSGWVRNVPDGTVEAVAAGSPDRLDRFESRIHEGPSAGIVERVESEEADRSDVGGEGFEIRR